MRAAIEEVGSGSKAGTRYKGCHEACRKQLKSLLGRNVAITSQLQPRSAYAFPRAALKPLGSCSSQAD